MKTPAPQVARLIDVAEAAGVSRPVAGRVLLGSGSNIRVSPKVAEKIRRVAQRLNYQPNQSARQLTGRRSHLIGLVVTIEPNSGTSARLIATEREARNRGYDVLIGQATGAGAELDACLSRLRQRGTEVVLVLNLPVPEAVEKLRDLPRTIFSIGQVDPKLPCVIQDRVRAVELSINHLVTRGKKRIALLSTQDNNIIAAQRKQGFQRAMRTHRLGDHQDLIYVVPRVIGLEPYRQEVRTAVTRLLERGADAIITGNDIQAGMVVGMLQQAGRSVPGDVAVIGYGNDSFTPYVTPSITTIDPRMDEFARVALDMTDQWILDGALPADQIVRTIEPRLLERESS